MPRPNKTGKCRRSCPYYIKNGGVEWCAAVLGYAQAGRACELAIKYNRAVNDLIPLRAKMHAAGLVVP
jgi:hypothetical protein